MFRPSSLPRYQHRKQQDATTCQHVFAIGLHKTSDAVAKYARHRTATVSTADLARHAVFAVALLGAEKVELKQIAMLCKSHRRLVEQRRPLERRPVQALALSAVAVLGVDGIAVVFELDCSQQTTPETWCERDSPHKCMCQMDLLALSTVSRRLGWMMHLRFPHQHWARYLTWNSSDFQTYGGWQKTQSKAVKSGQPSDRTISQHSARSLTPFAGTLPRDHPC